MASIPTFAQSMSKRIVQTTPLHYKRPSDLPDGKVLVIGASASGQQIARELIQSGRNVILSVGNHIRLPRTYRGVDICVWLDVLGATSISYDQVEDLERRRRAQSLALVAEQNLDLNELQALGAEVTGRLVGCEGEGVAFAGSLANTCMAADLKMNRFLNRAEVEPGTRCSCGATWIGGARIWAFVPGHPTWRVKPGVLQGFWTEAFLPRRRTRSSARRSGAARRDKDHSRLWQRRVQVSNRVVHSPSAFCAAVAQSLAADLRQLACTPMHSDSCDTAPMNSLLESDMHRWPTDQLKRIAQFIRDEAVDVVHSHNSRANLFGVLMKWMTRVPCVATANNRYLQPHWMFNSQVIAAAEATLRFHRRFNFVSRKISRIAFRSSLER